MKQTVFVNAGFSIILALVSLLQLISRLSVREFYYLAIVVSFCLGLAFVVVQLRWSRRPVFHLAPFIFIVVFSLLFSYAVCIILSGSAYFLTYHMSFLIPPAVAFSYQQFMRIPEAEFRLWYYNPAQTSVFSETENAADTRLMAFVLQKDPVSMVQTKLKVESPLHMPLGQIFFHLVEKYNRNHSSGPIRVESSGETEGWLFYSRRGLLKKRRIFDPDLTLEENGLATTDVIYAVRQRSSLSTVASMLSGA